MMMQPNWRDRPTVDHLLAFPRLRDLLAGRRKWALVNNLVSYRLENDHSFSNPLLYPFQKKFRRNAVHTTWQKWCSLKNYILHLLLAITTFFKLTHEKRTVAEDVVPMELQTTPKCNQSHLLARLDAINPLNGSTASVLDDSTDSALGVGHLPDGAKNDFHNGLLLDVVPSAESTIYSSTPIIHGAMNLRRSRLQTPNSPM